MEYEIIIYGEQKGKQRPRTGKYGNFYSPTSKWEEDMIKILKIYKGTKDTITKPVYIDIYYQMKNKEKKLNWKDHTKKPDIDNLNKAVFDAITKSGIWKDDSLVYRQHCEKVYCNDFENPSTKITIRSKNG